MSVLLIFPPIVTSGFGSYYPSLAVLAGHLRSKGIAVNQYDVNQDLARTLLTDHILSAIGYGSLPGIAGPLDPTNMASVAARLLQKNRSYIIDENGRLPSLEGTLGVGYLLPLICKSLQIDESVSNVLCRIREDCAVTVWYRQFFTSSSIQRLLTDDALELLAVSVPMGPQLLPALCLCQYVKQLKPDVKIVIGGATISLMHEIDLELILTECPYVDAAVRYEGEDALLSLARQVEANRWAPGEVSNVSCINKNGNLYHCAPRTAINLDQLAFADYSQDILAGLQEPELSVVQTRGCYWGRCAYCDFVELYDGSPAYRSRSPVSFVDEIEHHILTYHASRFSLITEAIPPSFARKFAKLVIERGLRIEWNSFAMVDPHFTEEHFLLMKASGCESLIIGLETMVDRVLSLVDKYASTEDNIAFLRTASAAGISLKINLIPNLPTTTYSEALNALEVLEGYSDLIDTVTVFPFEATRSSQIGRNPSRYGLIPTSNTNASGQALFAANHLDVADLGMSDEELAEVLILYRRYADKVNSRKLSRVKTLPLLPDSDVKLQIAHNDIDVINTAEHLLVFNWRTREHWRMPLSVGKIISVVSRRPPSFDMSELYALAIKYPETREYFQWLIDARILVQIEPK